MWCEPQFTRAKKSRGRSSISSERDGKNIEWREQMGVKKISRLIIREKCVDVLFYQIDHAMGATGFHISSKGSQTFYCRNKKGL